MSENTRLPSYKHHKAIVNAQVDINRANWAANLTELKPHSNWETAEDRDKYIAACVKSAIEALKKIK